MDRPDILQHRVVPFPKRFEISTRCREILWKLVIAHHLCHVWEESLKIVGSSIRTSCEKHENTLFQERMKNSLTSVKRRTKIKKRTKEQDKFQVHIPVYYHGFSY